jgi:hypothetical protein
MESGPVRVLKKELPGYALAMILNRGNQIEHVTPFDPNLDDGDVRMVTLDGGEDEAPQSIELAPHSARIIRLRR